MYPVTARAASLPTLRTRSARGAGNNPSTNALIFGPSTSIRNSNTRIVTIATTPVAKVRPTSSNGPSASPSESRIFGRFSFAHSWAPMSFSQRPTSPLPSSASRMVLGRSSLKLLDAS